MSGDFRFDFSKKSKGKKAVKPVPENLDENAKEYRERARAERKRFVDATDTEFWLCLCFPSPAEMARWRERFGFGENHRIYAYRDIEKLLAPYKPAKSSAVAFGAGVGFGGGLGFAEKTPDPLADVKYSDDLEKDLSRRVRRPAQGAGFGLQSQEARGADRFRILVRHRVPVARRQGFFPCRVWSSQTRR